jgi:multidrug efflux pump subunit AcrA (membrane-fusion protein)
MHLGGENNLNTANGIRDAIAELDGVRRALVRRGIQVTNGETVDDVLSEESWKGFSDDDGDEDDE